MGISNGRDKLQRVAFEDSKGNFYKFSINPQSMTEQYNARNNFMQTRSMVQMQGYGQGLHTIQISGVTGVNHGRGFDTLKELKNLVVTHINEAHDTETGDTPNLTFHNFTNGESWVVEMNTDGIKIEQSSRDPLSYNYSISMVVIQSADQPATSELTWIQLGNINPSLTPRSINSSYEYKYGTTALKDFDFNGLQTEINQFKASRKGVINNYGQRGMYVEHNLLSKGQIVALYKTVYGSVLPKFDFNAYVNATGYFKSTKKSTVNNYGQTDAGAIVNILPPVDVEKMYQILYGDVLDDVDYASFTRMSKLFRAMKRGSIQDYQVDGEADTSDDTLSIGDAVDMFSIIYGKTVKETDYDAYGNASGLFSQAKKESINDYGQDNVNDAMFTSYANYQVQQASDITNSWEKLTNSKLSQYNSNNTVTTGYVNPMVSKEAGAYTYYTLNNMLKV